MKNYLPRLSRKILLCWVTVLFAAILLASCGDTAPAAADTDTAAAETETEEEDTTMAEETEEDIPATPYYVCLYNGVTDSGVLGEYDTLEEAITACEEKKQEGYRVCDANGAVAYLPYTQLQCDLVREGKWVTDYVRTNGFTYGDAPINPAINCDAKKVSCDRLVTWVYYRVGYTDQPEVQGLVVSNFIPWLEDHAFEKITDPADLMPGDIVCVRPQSNGRYPGHVYLFAGYFSDESFYRYDCGSDYRIQQVQPMTDPMEEFMVAYRPIYKEATISLDGNTAKSLTLGQACILYRIVRDGDWAEDTSVTGSYTVILDSTEYRYDKAERKIYDVAAGRSFTVDHYDDAFIAEILALTDADS